MISEKWLKDNAETIDFFVDAGWMQKEAEGAARVWRRLPKRRPVVGDWILIVHKGTAAPRIAMGKEAAMGGVLLGKLTERLPEERAKQYSDHKYSLRPAYASQHNHTDCDTFKLAAYIFPPDDDPTQLMLPAYQSKAAAKMAALAIFCGQGIAETRRELRELAA